MQQEQVEARHVRRSAVRSATRRMALRARGLPSTSAFDGLMRPRASSFIALRRGKGRAAVVDLARMLGDELLDDAVFQRMEADHREPALGLQHGKARL